MTVALDMLTGAQDAIVALIRAGLPEDQRDMVRTVLKQGTQPPYHVIGDLHSENAGSKSDQLEDVEVDVHSVYRGSDKRELLAMMHQVRIATDEQILVIDGAQFRVTWLGAIASAAASDGVTFAGLTTLQLYAEPA